MLQIVRNFSQLNINELCDVYSIAMTKDNLLALSREQELINYLQDFFREGSAYIALWVVDGVYKASLRMEPYSDGYLLTALETAPQERNQGYATSLLNAVLKETKADRIYSHVEKKNLQSLHIHEKCGFHIVSDYAVLLDGSVFHSHVTLCYERQ